MKKNDEVKQAMNDAEFSEIIEFMAMAALRRLAKEVWHKLDFCSCDQGYFLPGIPCEIGLEEIEIEKASRQFACLDALGLGYVGPRIVR